MDKYKKNGKLKTEFYESELRDLQVELVRMQRWVRLTGAKIVVLFEGRDAAGKGGVIRRITEYMNPRICHTVALDKPTEKEESQWYLQRWIPHLPAAGEIALFDRSWYTRSGVEKVMGFCSEEENREFLETCPAFEDMLMRSGVQLIKYWFSINHEEQELRFKSRIEDPTKRWKLSPMDLKSRSKWIEYSKAKDEMFAATDTKEAPWFVVEADDKKKARLNCISHLLSLIPYEHIEPEPIAIPPKQENIDYERPPIYKQNFIPPLY